MNIQQYYRLAANISLNGSLLALVSVSLFVFPIIILLPKKEIVLFFIPFLFYSFVSYQNYLLHRQRSKDVKQNTSDIQTEQSLFTAKEMLLQFMPAPSLRLLIFNPKGYLIGELRDLDYKKYRWFLPYFIDKLHPREYGLFDEKKHLISVFRWKTNGMMEISGKSTGHGVFKFNGKQSGLKKNLWIFSSNVRTLYISSELFFTDILIKDKNQSLKARVRKGWMPLEWERYFKDANTPVLSFSERTETEDKLTIFAIMTALLRYKNH